MTDERDRADTSDPDTVNIADASARAFWARRLQVSVENLEAAVRAVGTEPARVAAHLGRPWPFEGSGIV